MRSKPGLSPREIDVIKLISEGLTNRQIAEKLWITEQTVKFHVVNILKELNVDNRVKAAIKYMRLEKCPYCGQELY